MPPIDIGVKDLPHLSVRGHDGIPLLSIREHLPCSQGSLLIERVAEGGFAQRTRKGWKEKGSSRLIVPNVGAVSITAAELIVTSLEAMELAVCGPEACRRDQSGEVGRSCLPHDSRQRALPHDFGEETGAVLQVFQVIGRVFRDFPCVSEPPSIEVPDDRLAFILGGLPPAPVRCAIWKVPGQQERKVC